MVLGATGCITSKVLDAFRAAGVDGGLLTSAIAQLQRILVEDARSALIIHHQETAKLRSQGASALGASAGPGANPVLTDPP